jgi:ribosomal protein L7/L12
MDDLRARVRELETLVDHLYTTLSVARPAPDTGFSPQVRELVMTGKTIQAIKRYREETGCDLATAKNAIESLR